MLSDDGNKNSQKNQWVYLAKKQFLCRCFARVNEMQNFNPAYMKG